LVQRAAHYIRISDSADSEQIIPLLNQYAGTILSAIRGHEGDVLKLIGDGTLDIFTAADRASACHCGAHRRSRSCPC
jgi:adenylate cyclase